MLKISHRGNTDGPNPVWENNPNRVMDVIYRGFDCEVDLWDTKLGYYLGHDQPKYAIGYEFLVNRHLWIHCKNIEAFVLLSQDKSLNLFYHKDGVALTTTGYLWTAPGLMIERRSIACMPELSPGWDYKIAYGICSDYVE